MKLKNVRADSPFPGVLFPICSNYTVLEDNQLLVDDPPSSISSEGTFFYIV